MRSFDAAAVLRVLSGPAGSDIKYAGLLSTSTMGLNNKVGRDTAPRDDQVHPE
jgi:hypothetical protein